LSNSSFIKWGQLALPVGQNELLTVPKEKPRQIAVEVLKAHAASGVFIESLLDNHASRANLSPVDRSLLQELTFGIVRWQGTLDWLIARKTKGRTQKAALQILLRLGLYQLFWLQRIPDHAAVNETVELARHSGFGPQAGFINAVLRSYIRERDQTVKLLEDLKQTNPALGYSHPEWLVQRWYSRWNKDDARKLLEWNNTPPAVFARVNTLRTNPEALLAQWKEEDVSATARQFDWVAEGLVYQLESFPPLSSLPSFQSGLFYIQDPSTLLSIVTLQPAPGEEILDLCAAPGGKTTLIAQIMNNRGLIVARDPHSVRRDLLRDNCLRLGVTCVKIEPLDASLPNAATFDRILVDAPCSNTGVMRRRVDSRWRIHPEELPRLAQTQRDLLQSAARQLKPGGTLVYSTCSLEPEENENVVREFLETHSIFRLDFERTLLPFKDGVDGAYVARLINTP
jgi:16S rRNA (cytosine967-C5)-methyltransferase